MLDIRFIRQFPDKVKKGCEAKQIKIDIEGFLNLDKKRREYLKIVEDLRAKENRLSYLINKETESKKRNEMIKEAQKIKRKIKDSEISLKEIEEKFQQLMFQFPNLPLDNVPIGKNEKDNRVIKKWGKIPKFEFQPKDYLEIAKKLDLIDIERAAKISGSRFGFIKREAVWLEFALINFTFKILTKENFIPIIPPVMMRSDMMRGMGYIEQTDREEAYYLLKDDLFLAGTSEQPIGAMHANEIFEEKELPKRYLGFSSCFRREAGAHGKDTKGIFRVHQFDKVEMFSFSHPKNSRKEHQFLLSMQERLMQALKIPYRVVQICTGDLGMPAAAKYDIEAWFPGQNRYRETHSTSNCTDFQARRLNIRFRDQKTKKLEFVHTLNGTAFAIGRILIAILENYQQRDGSIKIPEVLKPYLIFKKIKR